MVLGLLKCTKKNRDGRELSLPGPVVGRLKRGRGVKETLGDVFDVPMLRHAGVNVGARRRPLRQKYVVEERIYAAKRDVVTDNGAIHAEAHVDCGRHLQLADFAPIEQVTTLQSVRRSLTRSTPCSSSTARFEHPHRRVIARISIAGIVQRQAPPSRPHRGWTACRSAPGPLSPFVTSKRVRRPISGNGRCA